MTTQSVSQSNQRRLGRSILALLAGFVVAIVLSIGTDFALQALGLAPRLGSPWSNQLLFLATFYRSIYGVISSYVVARLAPNRPMGHALVGGAVGVVVSILGAVAAWNSNLGPHWYPVALVILAMPTAWIGGKLRVMQLQKANGKMAAEMS